MTASHHPRQPPSRRSWAASAKAPSFGRGRIKLGDWDCIGRQVVRVSLAQVRTDPANRFALRVMDATVCLVEISYHRIITVWRDVTCRNLPLARARFEAALGQLRRHPIVAADRTAALGYCFDGTVVLEMARLGLDLDAVVSYHASLALSTPAEAGRIKARVAVFKGGDDPMIPPTQVEAFRQDMHKAGAQLNLLSYPGV